MPFGIIIKLVNHCNHCNRIKKLDKKGAKSLLEDFAPFELIFIYSASAVSSIDKSACCQKAEFGVEIVQRGHAHEIYIPVSASVKQGVDHL